MKNRIAYITSVFFVCSSFFGCSNFEDLSTNSVVDTRIFYAQLPSSDDGETKTYLDGDMNMYWYAEDKLSVFQSSTNEKYRFAGTSGEIANEFHKCDASIPGASFPRNYAVYPYSESTTCSAEGTIKTTLPSVQHYSPDTFGQDANTMIAVTQDNEDDVFYFQNVCGYLRLKIYGGDTILKITLKGNNGEKLAGEATITAAYGMAPAIELSESATAEITLDCGEDGVPTVDDPDQYTSFWFVVPPVNFTKGFTIEITTSNGITRSQFTDKYITISCNRVIHMAGFECGAQTNPKISSFMLSNGVQTFKAFDISDGYVNIMVPNQTDLSNMTVSFTYRGISVKVDGVEQASGQNKHNFNDFAVPVEYIVTSSDKTFQTYKIRIFNLPVLFIETPGRLPITSKNTWIGDTAVKIRRTDNTEEDLGLTSIKGRGNATWNFPKKPYALKFDTKQSFWGLPIHKRWCLLANYIDKTLIRNAVSLEIARSCSGIAWTPDGDYVEVILNGKHIGNYYLCEQIKIGENRINISEECGHLMLLDEYWDETYKFRSAYRALPYMFKDPDVVTEEQFNSIQAYVDEMEASIYDDTKFQTRDYLNYLDMASIIDCLFVYELSMNFEPVNPRSVYMYKDGDGPFYMGPVWDFDNGTFLPIATNSWRIMNGALYYPRLIQDQEFKNEIYKRWVYSKLLFEKITDYISNKSIQLRASEARDRIIWPFLTGFNNEQDLTYDQAVARMRQAYLDKLAWMDEQIKLMPVFKNDQSSSEDYSDQQDHSADFNFGF